MKHLDKKELDVLRHLQHDLPKMLRFGNEGDIKFLDFNYVPGRRRDMSRPHGEHYLEAGKNIDGAYFDMFGDKWLFYIRSGSGYPFLMVKIIPDYLKEPYLRRGPVINGEISYDRLDQRIVNDVRRFYQVSPLYYDASNEALGNGLPETPKPLAEPTFKKPK